MKTFITSLLISISCIYSTYGRALQLNDYTWYVHSVETSSGEVIHPIDPALFIETEFDLSNNQLTSIMCCGGSFEAEITPDNNSFSLSDFTRNDDACDNTESNNFSTAFKDFFQDVADTAFSYTLSQNNYTVKLEITDYYGRTAILYNSPHDINAEPFVFYGDVSSGIEEWYVVSIKVDGANYSGEDLKAEEFGEITASFNYDGTFETEVCAILSGKFSLFYRDNHSFTLACDNLNTNDTDCSQPDNTTLQEAYFDFFRNNSDDVMDLETVDIDGQTGPCEADEFVITASSGDYVWFTSCSSLNTKKYKQSTIKLYPNPSTEKVTIETNGLILKKPKLYTLQGRQIEVDFIKEGNKHLSFNTTNLVSGTYLLQLQSEQGEKITKKLVVE